MNTGKLCERKRQTRWMKEVAGLWNSRNVHRLQHSERLIELCARPIAISLPIVSCVVLHIICFPHTEHYYLIWELHIYTNIMNMRGSTRCDAVAALINTKIIAVHLLASSSHQLFFLAKKQIQWFTNLLWHACFLFAGSFCYLLVFWGKKLFVKSR